jgi:hypothetical protein
MFSSLFSTLVPFSTLFFTFLYFSLLFFLTAVSRRAQDGCVSKKQEVPTSKEQGNDELHRNRTR